MKITRGTPKRIRCQIVNADSDLEEPVEPTDSDEWCRSGDDLGYAILFDERPDVPIFEIGIDSIRLYKYVQTFPNYTLPEPLKLPISILNRNRDT